VKNRSRVLTALVAKFTTCSHPASNIVFMMVFLIGIYSIPVSFYRCRVPFYVG
jgi:hypothetical protein